MFERDLNSIKTGITLKWISLVFVRPAPNDINFKKNRPNALLQNFIKYSSQNPRVKFDGI